MPNSEKNYPVSGKTISHGWYDKNIVQLYGKTFGEKKYKRKHDFDAMLSHIFPWQSWPQGRDVDNQSDSTYLSKIPHSLKKKLDGILFSHDGAHPHPKEALLLFLTQA